MVDKLSPQEIEVSVEALNKLVTDGNHWVVGSKFNSTAGSVLVCFVLQFSFLDPNAWQ